MLCRRSSLCLLLSAFCLPSTAQPLRLSVADAVQRALHEGSRAQLAQTVEERARIARTEALQALFPQADARIIRYNQSINLQTFGFSLPGQPPVVGPFNVTDAQVEAAMQLFNLAAIRHYQALNQGESASRYALQRAENDVAAAVARLYVLTQRASTQISSRQAEIALFQRLLKVAQDEFNAGTGTRLDVAQATVQLDRAKQALLIAENDQRTTLLALLNAIGLDQSTDVVLVDPLPAAAPPVPPVEAALATARQERPELREVEARVKEASLGVSAARARKIPSVGFDFVGDYSGNRTRDLLWTRRIAATLGMPLFRADINAAVARAKADLHDAEINRSQRQRDVEQDVRRSILNLENANARVAVATENVRVAEEALNVAEDRRSAGYGTPVEVDRAQDSYRQAREDLIAAQADAAAALYDLQHATGEIRKTIEATR
jgi:outer membrane protein TolC